MKKNLLTKAAVLAMSAVLAMPVTVYAAPPTSAPIEMSVKQDGKTHKVFVFGASMALVSTDGSIEISNMGPVGRVDVMIDGTLTKNVSSIDIPAGQHTKMVLDEGSVVVKNVSAESVEAVKKQINDAYSADAGSVDLAALANVTAYKVNENGTLVNTAGNTVSSTGIGMTVSSVDAASTAFTEEITEIVQREAIEADAAATRAAIDAAPAAPAVETPKKGKKPSSSGSSSGGSGNEGGNEGGNTPPVQNEN